MRILAGKYKNRKLITATKNIKLEAKKIRPTTEKLRIAAFNILRNFFGGEHVSVLKDKKVLDLCCGIGSFGIEALSRGASLVTFIDNYYQHLEIVKLNLEKLNCIPNSKVIFANAQNLGVGSEVYDLIYIDPPYKLNVLNKIIESLQKKRWIDKNSLIIVESSKKEVSEKVDDKLTLIDKREYGNSSMSFYRVS
ncbi:MAG: 16S rRNA (guanine(966)-N(2))-methyltransferase RsmD [Candidatus Midichloria sp.]|nr:MAG: 16S rRNA (guanine(966)-N(2))-methyltransferase RsmD [Candidatus Midichloria sp.]